LLLNNIIGSVSNLYSQTDIKEFLKSDINILKKKIGKQFNDAERQSEIENKLINQGRN
jgi:hypothetical protein